MQRNSAFIAVPMIYHTRGEHANYTMQFVFLLVIQHLENKILYIK
jgi:hypothetical protein